MWRLQGLLAKAAETLAQTMETGTPSVALRAAVAVIEQAYKGAELLDLAERVRALEESEPRRGEL